MEVVTVSDHTKAFPKQRADINLSRTFWVCPGGLHQVRHAWNTSPRRCPSQVTSDVSKRKEKKGFGSRGIKPPGRPPWTLPGPQTTSPPQPDLLSDQAKEPQLSGLFLWPGSSTDPGEGNSLFFSSSSFVVRAVSPKQENGTGVNPQTSRVRKVRAPLTPQGLHQELSDAPAQIWDVRLVFNHMGAKRNYWASFRVVAIY